MNIKMNGKIMRGVAQSGMTLMEILLVISIMAFLLVGGLTLFSQAQSSAQAQRGQQQLLGLATNVRSLFGGRPDFTGLSSDIMLDAQAVPADMDGADSIRNAWGGVVDMQTGNNCPGGIDEGDFCITFPSVPREACIRMLTTGGGQGGFRFAQVEGGGMLEAQVEPVDVVTATQECQAGDNTIVWTF